MKYCYSVLLGLAILGFAGCIGSGADNNAVVEVDYQPVQVIKDGLEGLKKSGRIGSNFGGLIMAVKDLKKTDEAKGAELEKELNELGLLQDPAKIKAKAAEILAKI